MVVTRLPYRLVHLNGFSSTTWSPCNPPLRVRPRGIATSNGWVDSGQSMVRAVSTARLLVFHSTRVHTSLPSAQRADAPVSVASIPGPALLGGMSTDGSVVGTAWAAVGSE